MTQDDLHPRLAADTIALAEWQLSRVRLMNDQRFPWIVLIPRIAGAREIFDLTPAQQATLIGEISRAARALSMVSAADKINVGALGNLVPQLHVHIVARKIGDDAWPGPVWGHGTAIPYDWAGLSALARQLDSGWG